jgi:glycosyltransferase involved in cell wall biosynthesis
MKEPLRIGIEAQRLFRKKKHGIEIVALEVIRELQKIDTVNQYFIFAKKDEDMSCLTETPNFRIIALPPANFAVWEQFILPRAVKKYNLDVLHCTGNTAPVLHTTKTLITIHDIFFTSFANIKGSTYQVLGNLYRKIIFPRLASYDHLITVSETEKNNIVSKLPISPQKIDVIYNGVNPKFRPLTNSVSLDLIRKKYNLPPAFIFFFSNTAPKKNTVRVLQAFSGLVKEVPDAKLVITDSSGYYVKQCLDQIEHPGLSKNIVILDFVVNDDLPAIYNLATIYLFPSLEESFGLPLIEAQASGTPVITSNVSAMPEIADSSALLVDPYDVASIRDAMRKLWLDEKLRSELREQGFTNAQRFSWRRTAEQLLDQYRKLA